MVGIRHNNLVTWVLLLIKQQQQNCNSGKKLLLKRCGHKSRPMYLI